MINQMFGCCNHKLWLTGVTDEELLAQYKADSSLLLFLCNNGYNRGAIRLIKLDNNCCDVIEKGDTPLLVACRKKMVDVAEAILETKKGLVHHIGPDGRLASMWIFDNFDSRESKALKLIWSQLTDKDLEVVDRNGQTHFTILIMKRFNIPQLKQYKTDYIDCKGDTYLHIAIRYFNFKVAHELIEDSCREIGHANKEGDTPLIEAIKIYNRFSDLYTSKDADMKMMNSFIIALIEKKGSNLSYKNKDKQTALHFAIVGRNVEVCHKLLDFGKFDPYELDEFKVSLLTRACNYRLYDIVARLSGGNTMLVEKLKNDNDDDDAEAEEERIRNS